MTDLSEKLRSSSLDVCQLNNLWSQPYSRWPLQPINISKHKNAYNSGLFKDTELKFGVAQAEASSQSTDCVPTQEFPKLSMPPNSILAGTPSTPNYATKLVKKHIFKMFFLTSIHYYLFLTQELSSWFFRSFSRQNLINFKLIHLRKEAANQKEERGE